MKNIILYILLFVCLFAVNSKGQVTFTPSAYFTYGDYSNENNSKSYAFYSTVGLNNSNHIMAAFESLNINSKDWKYNQKMLSVGYTKTLYPFYLKVNYAHVKGEFDFKPFPFMYDDILNVYNTAIIYNYNLFYFGGSFTYQDLNGFKSIVAKQFRFNVDWIISSKVTASISPLYTTVTDSRELSSVYGKIIIKPVESIELTVGSMVGKRAYYFDENLYTIFNQDEIQKSLYKVKLVYKFTKKFTLPLIFQYSDFETYNIKYLSAGLTYKL